MSGLLDVFRSEFRRIFTVRPAFAVMVLGAAFYALIYPQPYLNEALRNVPIAVVDVDDTQASRDFARRVDATSDVAVTMALPDLASAEREVYARRVDGILVIPQYFERELLHGRPSPVALYADASYFLIYQRVAGAVAAVARTVGAEIETARLIGIGVDPVIAAAAPDPMPLTAVPLFNPEGGYATYVLPAAFVLLLQQMLLMGVALLGTMPGIDAVTAGETVARPGPLAVDCGQAAGLSRAGGDHPAGLPDRAALSVRLAAAWRRGPDPDFRHSVRVFGCGPRHGRRRHFSQAAPGATDPGRGRSSPVHVGRLLLAGRSNPALDQVGNVPGAQHVCHHRLCQTIATRRAAVRGQAGILHALGPGAGL